jgi:hypothetical protein
MYGKFILGHEHFLWTAYGFLIFIFVVPGIFLFSIYLNAHLGGSAGVVAGPCCLDGWQARAPGGAAASGRAPATSPCLLAPSKPSTAILIEQDRPKCHGHFFFITKF